MEEGHLSSGFRWGSCFLVKTFVHKAFVPGIHDGDSPDTCQGTGLGTWVLKQCLTIRNWRNIFVNFFFFSSPNWNVFLCLLCLSIHSSGEYPPLKTARASPVPTAAASSLSTYLEPIPPFPARPFVIVVMHKSYWISSRGKAIAACDFVPHSWTRMPYPEQWFIMTSYSGQALLTFYTIPGLSASPVGCQGFSFLGH